MSLVERGASHYRSRCTDRLPEWREERQASASMAPEDTPRSLRRGRVHSGRMCETRPVPEVSRMPSRCGAGT